MEPHPKAFDERSAWIATQFAPVLRDPFRSPVAFVRRDQFDAFATLFQFFLTSGEQVTLVSLAELLSLPFVTAVVGITVI